MFFSEKKIVVTSRLKTILEVSYHRMLIQVTWVELVGGWGWP